MKCIAVLQSCAHRRRITGATGSAPPIVCGEPQAALCDQKLKDRTTSSVELTGEREGETKKKKKVWKNMQEGLRVESCRDFPHQGVILLKG